MGRLSTLATVAVQHLPAHDDEPYALRSRDLREVLLRHDWRHRIVELCGHFGLPLPLALAEDLQRVQALAGRFV